MQTILFIQKKLDDKDVEIIKEALEDTRVDFKIRQADNMVIIDGRNDIVHVAKVAITQAGYNVE